MNEGNGTARRVPPNGVAGGGARLYRHLDDDEIRDACRFALNVVAELEPDDDLRPHVFNAAWGARTRYYAEAPEVLVSPALGIRREG